MAADTRDEASRPREGPYLEATIGGQIVRVHRMQKKGKARPRGPAAGVEKKEFVKPKREYQISSGDEPAHYSKIGLKRGGPQKKGERLLLNEEVSAKKKFLAEETSTENSPGI